MKSPEIVGTPEEIDCLVRVLTTHPWQVWDVKVDGWVRVPRRSKSLITGQTMKWRPSKATPMVLMQSGKPIVEFDRGLAFGVLGLSAVLFAGDPHIGGAFWTIVGSDRGIWFSHPLSMDRETALAEAMAMAPDKPHSEVVREAIGRERFSPVQWMADSGFCTALGPRWVDGKVRAALRAPLQIERGSSSAALIR